MRLALAFVVLAVVACGGGQQPRPAGTTPGSSGRAPRSASAAGAPETVTVRDEELEREAIRLRTNLLERSAQLSDVERKLDEATTEVVRAMARLRTLATRAEAASAMAEAEVALQQLRGRAGQQLPPEGRQAEESLRMAGTAFDGENYGGAVYLATQAKRAATAGRGRLAETTGTARAGERAFVVPVALMTTGRANLRSGPGTATDVIETVPASTPLTAYAYAQDWMRVTMADGRIAWVHQGLVRGVAAGGP